MTPLAPRSDDRDNHDAHDSADAAGALTDQALRARAARVIPGGMWGH